LNHSDWVSSTLVRQEWEEKLGVLALKAFGVLGTSFMQRPHDWILAPVLAVVCALAGCAAKQEVVQPARAPLAKMVGRVATVDAAGRYVLIQVYGTWSVPNEVLLRVYSDANGASTLRPTGERQGRYVAADIVAGNPGPGDGVMYAPASDDEASPAVPEMPNPAAPADAPPADPTDPAPAA